jgi:ion channel POLLUX/CASTOR
MKKASVSEKLRYWFDNVMAKGAGALITLLAVSTLVFIAFAAIVITILGLLPPAEGEKNPPGFFEVMWQNLMRTVDSGAVGADQGPALRTAMLIVTIFGILVVASLIGIISSAFDSKVEELRKGRSRVLESEHTLILGWSSKVFPIISEICIANESRKNATIVILADRDKVEMDDEIHTQIPHHRSTRIICRSGDPMNLRDLEVSNPHGARSVIILAPEDSPDPDSVVIKTALALTNHPERKSSEYHIIGEIRELSNLEAARLVGRDEAHWVLGNELISRVTVQSCRQSGLSVVYTDLLDFEGDEIYFTVQPSLVGKTYFDTQLAFADSTVIGFVTDGEVRINPPATTPYGEGDQLIVIAEDDSTIHLAAPGAIDAAPISRAAPAKVLPERTLILGFNREVMTILGELNEYVAAGSVVTIVADVKPPVLKKYDKITVAFQRGDATSRGVLEGLKVHDYNHIIVLAYKDTLEPQLADARTLITLLHLRDMADRAGKDLNVVSEMLDDRNRELAEVTKADDFIVSDKLISLMMSQVSENRQLKDVFGKLFSSEGSEIYLRPAGLYIRKGESADFYTILEAARRRGETAIGYRIAEHARNSERAYGVTINPKKADLLAFAPEDKVIVLAEG